MNRRDFLKTLGLVMAGATVAPELLVKFEAAVPKMLPARVPGAILGTIGPLDGPPVEVLWVTKIVGNAITIAPGDVHGPDPRRAGLAYTVSPPSVGDRIMVLDSAPHFRSVRDTDRENRKRAEEIVRKERAGFRRFVGNHARVAGYTNEPS